MKHDPSQIESIAQKLTVMLLKIRNAYGSREGTIILGEEVMSFMVKPNIVEKRAWRYIILSPGAEKFGNLEVQLNWDRLSDPYTSWSTSEQAVEAFSEMHGRDDAFRVLVEGTVKGFVIIDYTMSIIQAVNKISPLIKDNLELYQPLMDGKIEALSCIDAFLKEKEIIALEVLDFRIVKHVTQI